MAYFALETSRSEIRMLKILPSESSGRITVCLTHVSLTDPPPFKALSYCWGPAVDPKPIIVNNCVMHVTQNLHSALQQFKSQMLNTYLWVDALCINQEDLEERSSQVLYMRDIYMKAELVIVWLGEATPVMKSAFELLALWAADRPFVHQNRKLLDLSYQGPSIGSGGDISRQTFTNGWNGLVDLVNIVYWRRTWIIQEVVVASEVLIRCGQLSMQWNLFSWAINRLCTAVRSEVRTAVFPEGHMGLRAVKDLLAFRYQNSISDASKIGLLQAMELTSQSLATERRDKIYALLGLTFDGAVLVQNPDYTCSLEVILTDFTKAVINADNKRTNLLFLRLPTKRDNEDLPSWVPDLDDLLGTFQDSALVNRWYDAGCSSTTTAVPEFVEISDGPQLLKIRGRIIDTIGNVSLLPSEQPDLQISPLHPETISDPVQTCKSPYGSQSQTFNAIWRTIFSNVHTRRVSALPPTWALHFSALYPKLTEPDTSLPPNIASWLTQNASSVIAGRDLKSWATSSARKFLIDTQSALLRTFALRGRKVVDELQTEFLDAMEQAVTRRRLVVLKSGGVAMAHVCGRPEDAVVVVEGWRMPILLRPEEGGER